MLLWSLHQFESECFKVWLVTNTDLLSWVTSTDEENPKIISIIAHICVTC